MSQFHRHFIPLGFSSADVVHKNHPDTVHGATKRSFSIRSIRKSSDGVRAGRQEDGETAHYHLFHDKHRIEPYFDNVTSKNITTSSGKTAYLPCRVQHLGDRTVSITFL